MLFTYYDLRAAQLNNRRDDYFSPCFLGGSKMYSLFLGTPSPHAIKYVTDKKHVVCNRASLCDLTRAYLYYLHESTNHVDLPGLV